MNKIRIYIDNSVIGGIFDREFEEDTKLLFERIKDNIFTVYISDITNLELELAPDYIKKIINDIPKDCLITLDFTKEAEELAENYIKENILGKASTNDAYHIAIASINRIDVLVSWNFRHIVNYNKIKLFNSVNLKLGYPEIDIRSPNEIVEYEN